MKCKVCSFEFSDDRKSCPNCGRIITETERRQNAEKSAGTHTSSVYRPASSRTTSSSDEAAFVQSIFSTDPNAPEYKNPHTYDRATADVLEYDKNYMSRSKAQNPPDEIYNTRVFDSKYNKIEEPTIIIEQEYDTETDNYEEDNITQDKNTGSVNRDKESAKPHLKINFKIIAIIILGLVGIAIIIVGITQLVKHFGIAGSENENTSLISGQSVDSTKDHDDKADEELQSGYKTGYYTVTADGETIFMKNDEERIIATIPNRTIIEITEIENDYGKAIYGDYTGWVDMSALTFTPNERPETPTQSEPTSEAETTTQSETTTQAETTTQPETTTEATTTATYTVSVTGNANALNVRENPDADSQVIGTIKNGEKVIVDEIQNGWGRTFIGEVEGWINMEFVH